MSHFVLLSITLVMTGNIEVCYQREVTEKDAGDALGTEYSIVIDNTSRDG